MKVAQVGQIKESKTRQQHPPRTCKGSFRLNSASRSVDPLLTPIPVPRIFPQAKHAPNTRSPSRGCISNSLSALSSPTDHGITALRDGPGALGDITPFVVAAFVLGPVNALRRGNVTDGLAKTSLAKLASGQVVNVILDGVDLLVAGYLCLVEVF